MINIISTQADKTNVRGPYKVYKNLIKGLDKLGYPYVINHKLNATKRLWIHDNLDALRYIDKSKAFKLIGPNLVVLPNELPKGINLLNTIYLLPCDWVKILWEKQGFNECILEVWPVGIDTEEYKPSGINRNDRKVLVYHKQRETEELVFILETLHHLNLKYNLILYSQYSEAEFKKLLATTSFVIWHGGSESQGIALQEALACNLPIIVCDVSNLYQARNNYHFPDDLASFRVTAAPFFNETCGFKIVDLNELSASILRMTDQLNNFHPREFVIRNLSLEGQARKFVGFWEKWAKSYAEGLEEKCLINKKFQLPLLDKVRRKIG
jgi:glycosyltransferase involved in cell wall biosynthesis